MPVKLKVYNMPEIVFFRKLEYLHEDHKDFAFHAFQYHENNVCSSATLQLKPGDIIYDKTEPCRVERLSSIGLVLWVATKHRSFAHEVGNSFHLLPGVMGVLWVT